jgi:hypothetical protein
MAFVWFNQGEGITAKATLNIAAGETLQLALYKNNRAPAAGDTEANYTEATFPGYARKTLAPGTWVVVEGAPTHATYAEQMFERTAAGADEPQYGYMLVQNTSGKVVGAEAFAAATRMQEANDRTYVSLDLSFAGSLG